MSILRDIFRRRLRSTLTILGIALGVFALVVLGALAEKAELAVRTTADYYRDRVVVVEKRAADALSFNLGGSGSRPLSQRQIDALKDREGVLDVAPQVVLALDEQALPIGTPRSIMGGFVGTDAYRERWKVARGRVLADSERGVAVVGADLVKQLGAEVGGTVRLRGEDFDVVGIGAVSNTPLDQAVVVPLADSRRLLVKTLPPQFASSIDTAGIASQATAYVRRGVDPDVLSTTLNRDLPTLRSSGPAGLKKQLGQGVILYSGLLASVGTVALLVSCLSIVNTMLMSVSERNREVGLKRALGASRWRVGRDVLVESVVLGALGGLLGLAAGMLVAVAGNAAADAGSGLFVVTARLAAGAVAFAAALGGIAGVYPAWRTARADPVTQLAAR